MRKHEHRRLRHHTFIAIAALSGGLTAAAGLAEAQTRMKSDDPNSVRIRSAPVAEPDARAKASYKKSTWLKYREGRKRSEIGSLKAGSTEPAIPPTDCPPLPAQDCLDTWKVITVSPFE